MRKLLLLLLVLVACVPPPKPPDPQPPNERMVQFSIIGADGHTPPGTWSAIQTDNGNEYECAVIVAPDRIGCILGPEVPVGDSAHPEAEVLGANAIVTNTAYESYNYRFALNGLNQTIPDAKLKRIPEVVFMNRLVDAGEYFRLDNGQQFTWIGASDFNLFNRYLMGENIDPTLTQRAKDVGFNVLRVWTAYNVCPPGNGCQEIGRLVPAEHPDYDAKLASFAKKLTKFNLRIELTAFTGPYDQFFHSPRDFVDHWNRLIRAAVENNNVVLELVNEFDQTANSGIPFDQLQRPPQQIVTAHGSNGSQALPVRPWWSFETMHFNDAPEWQRKVGHNCMEDGYQTSHTPCVGDENTRAPDHFNNITTAYDAAAGCALLSAGCTFHSVHGKNSTLWTGDELENAKAWVRGGKSVPLSCQYGPYRRIDDANYMRVYQRGNDPACIVRIHW